MILTREQCAAFVLSQRSLFIYYTYTLYTYTLYTYIHTYIHPDTMMHIYTYIYTYLTILRRAGGAALRYIKDHGEMDARAAHTYVYIHTYIYIHILRS